VREWLEVLAHLGFVALAVGSVWYAEAATRPPMPLRAGRALLPWWCLGLLLLAYVAWACIRYGAQAVGSGGPWLVVLEVLALAALARLMALLLRRAVRAQSTLHWGTEEAMDWIDVVAWLWVAGLAVTMVAVLVLVPEIMHVPHS
jgi:hypothetical protein